MPIDVPNDSQCLGCGYKLRELQEPVCPECARAFDPDDPTTYNVDPVRRRKRLIKRIVITVVVLGVLAAVLWPRGMSRAQITFTDKASGTTSVVKRWEPMPPRWIPFRYPGWHWTTTDPGHAIDVSDPASYTINASASFGNGGSGSIVAGGSPGLFLTVNDIPASPRHAVRLLRMLQEPDNNLVQTNLVPPAELRDPP